MPFQKETNTQQRNKQINKQKAHKGIKINKNNMKKDRKNTKIQTKLPVLIT